MPGHTPAKMGRHVFVLQGLSKLRWRMGVKCARRATEDSSLLLTEHIVKTVLSVFSLPQGLSVQAAHQAKLQTKIRLHIYVSDAVLRHSLRRDPDVPAAHLVR